MYEELVNEVVELYKNRVIDQTIQDKYNLEIPVPGKKDEDSNSTDKDDTGNSIDLFDFAYNVGAGVIDNGLRLITGGGNPYGAGAIMFSQVTTSSMIEGKEKGFPELKVQNLLQLMKCLRKKKLLTPGK